VNVAAETVTARHSAQTLPGLIANVGEDQRAVVPKNQSWRRGDRRPMPGRHRKRRIWRKSPSSFEPAQPRPKCGASSGGRTGVSGTGGENRIGDKRETDQHKDRMAARFHCPGRSPLAHVPSTGGRLARMHRNYLPNASPPPTGTGENDLPFLGLEVTQLHSEVQYGFLGHAEGRNIVFH